MKNIDLLFLLSFSPIFMSYHLPVGANPQEIARCQKLGGLAQYDTQCRQLEQFRPNNTANNTAPLGFNPVQITAKTARFGDRFSGGPDGSRPRLDPEPGRGRILSACVVEKLSEFIGESNYCSSDQSSPEDRQMIANAFCQRKGYKKAIDFHFRDNRDRRHDSYVLQRSNGQFVRRTTTFFPLFFTEVTCSK